VKRDRGASKGWSWDRIKKGGNSRKRQKEQYEKQ